MKNDDLYYNNILKYIKESFHIVSYKIINKLFNFIDYISTLERLETHLKTDKDTLRHNNYTVIVTLYKEYFNSSIKNIDLKSIQLVDLQSNLKDIDNLQKTINEEDNNVIRLYCLLNNIIKNIKIKPTEDIKNELLKLVNMFTANINIESIENYFTNFKNILEPENRILIHIYDIINDVCKLLIGSSIENCMRDILTTYFKENHDNLRNYNDA